MADRTRAGAAPKATPFPREWSRMSKPAKEQWLAKNRPGHPNAAQPTQQPTQQPTAGVGYAPQQPGAEQGQEQGGQQLIGQEQATHTVAEQIADQMGEMDLRGFVADVLRAVATAIEGAAPADDQEF